MAMISGEVSLLALFLETLFYGALVNLLRAIGLFDLITPNRRILHFILANVVHPTEEKDYSASTPHPSSNLIVLHCNGRAYNHILQEVA